LRLISRMSVYNSADELKSVLRKAETYAQSGREHSDWGVHYNNSVATLFKGDTYNRDQSFDEKTNIDEKVSVAGFTDIVFIAPGGRPQTPISNIILTRDNLTVSFSINAEGVIE